jgi:Mrp family chromosome partitioning ATPase
MVSDTYHLASLSDTCLLVIRPRRTLRDVFEHTLEEINSSGTRGVSLVINDIKADSKQYGYGEKYGYIEDKKKPKKHFFSTKKV